MMRDWTDKLRRLAVPGSLRKQLLMRSLFILAALLMLVGVLQFVSMQSFVYDQKAESMVLQLRSLPRDLDSRFEGAEAAPVNAVIADSADRGFPHGRERMRSPFLLFADTSLALYRPNGSYTDLSAENGITSPRLADAEYESLMSGLREDRAHVRYRVAVDEEGREQLLVFQSANPMSGPAAGLLQLGTETAPLKAMLLRQFTTFAVLSLLAMLGGLLLYLPVLRRTLVPLSNMVKALERTDAGNLDERLPVTQGQEEIDRLSASYNGMLERLALSFEAEREAKEQMRRFIADASHELRTPLTSIHGFLEVLLRGAADKPEQLYLALRSMHGESTRIKKLVEDLLLLAKLDRAPSLHRTEVPLHELLTEMEPHLRMLAGERTVRFDIADNLRASCDADQTKQAVLNLFHNAAQHTDSKTGVIDVTLRQADGAAELAVRDNGPGIAEEHLPHLFERFYRSDSSRTRKYGGAGLGLAITRSIADAHGWTIDVKSIVGEGSTFMIRMPLE
jgi:two-component system, OmpR family, sensor kinase